MFESGNLLYFTPFYFKDLSLSKNKYFLVLKVMDGLAVLASLPSSKIHLPSTLPLVHGCVEIPEACINAYIFEANRPISYSGFSFPLTTMLYGQHLDTFEISILQEIYPTEGVDFEVIGKILDTEFEAIVRCFANSATVKRKYKRLLST